MPNVTHEARKAHRIMRNLVFHINRYTNDSLYIGNSIKIFLVFLFQYKGTILSLPEAMMKLKENIIDFPLDVDLHNLGPLVIEFESIDMKLLTSEDHYRKYKLMIFQDYLGKSFRIYQFKS